jgi:hypothetical protein
VQTAAIDDGNSAVDKLFRKIPASETALLDPLKGLSGKARTIHVAVPELADGEKKIDSGGFGALGWYFMLAARIPMQQALAAADGRGGDSYVSFKRDDTVCVRASYAGSTGADTTRMLTGLRRWVAAAPSSPAKVSRPGDLVSFESCDPGPKATAGKENSDQAVNLLMNRAALGVLFVRKGATASRADCLSDKMAKQFTTAQLKDPHAADDPAVHARLVQIGASCRNT